MTRQQIEQAIETFRKITMANTITPENVGVLLRALLDFATGTDEAAQAAATLLTGYSLHARPAHDSITVTLRNALGNIVGKGCEIPLAEGSKSEAGLLSPREKEQIEDNHLDILRLAADLDESTHELYNYIDQSDQFITTELTKKITAAGTKASEALQLAESLDSSIGEPEGLATLDERGHLDPGQIDPDTIGVRVFNRFVEGVTVEQVGIIDIPGLSSIVYDTQARKFLLQAGAKYYEAWPDSSKYNSPLTREPHPERIYICTSKGGVWWWNGQELEDIIAQALIFQKISRAETKTFDDLFLAAGGTWARIDHTHTNEDGTPSPYYLNELWLTYPEAVAVYQAGAIDTQYCELRYYGLDIRTNLPPVCSSWASGSTATKYQLAEFIRKSNIEILNLSSRYHRFCIGAGGIGHVTFVADKLRKIIGGGIDIGCYTGKNNHQLFGSCPELTEVEIFNLHSDLNLSGLPKLNAASVRTLIERKYNIGSEATAAYTVTLHADVYNKIVEAADIADGDKLSAWSGLLELAASKNITFASA